LPPGECRTAPLISFSMIRLGTSGLNCLNAGIPTCPEQWDGVPTSGCSSKIETDTFLLAAANAAVAPLTPHPTMAMSVELWGKVVFSRLPSLEYVGLRRKGMSGVHYLMFRCSAISTRRLPFIWRETLTNPLTSNFRRIRFISRKLISSLPLRISRSSSSSVSGPFRPITSRTKRWRGRGPHTFSNRGDSE